MSGNYVGQAPALTPIPASLINAPNGIAGLDAAAKLMAGQFRQLKAVTFTRDMTLASGNQAVVGVGFKPRAAFFFATITPGSVAGQASLGLAADGTPVANSVFGNGSNATAQGSIVSNAACIQMVESGTAVYAGAVASFDADGFTIAWTRTGAKTGNATMQAFCLF